MKTCTKCKELKFNDEFFVRKDRPCGIMGACKVCGHKVSKSWKVRNPERTKELSRKSAAEFFKNNPERVRANSRASVKRRLKESREFRILQNLRRRLHHALLGRTKSNSTKVLLGCSPGELCVHLENQFKPGMTWENYGAWEIDHIRPCSSFTLMDTAQQRQCFHFSNLQPLFRKDNLQKSDSWG